MLEPYKQLEQELIKWSGCQDVVVCSSGTAALHLALEVLDLPHNSTVIVPDYTMIACPRAVSLTGLGCVLVDCDRNLLMNLDLVYQILNSSSIYNSHAVMAVHIYGKQLDIGILHNFNTKPLNSIGRPAYIIEDMAELHGIKPHPNTDIACWSFYKNKIVAGEEGGAIGFRNKGLASKARQLRSLGFTEQHDFNHIPRGHNYRMSNTHAELINYSLSNFNNSIIYRRGVEYYYDQVCPRSWKINNRQSPWVYDIRIPRMVKDTQIGVINKLNKIGIEARYGFKPIHTQEEYKSCLRVGGEAADKYSTEVVYLPLKPDISKVGVNNIEEFCQLAIDTIKSML